MRGRQINSNWIFVAAATLFGFDSSAQDFKQPVAINISEAYEKKATCKESERLFLLLKERNYLEIVRRIKDNPVESMRPTLFFCGDRAFEYSAWEMDENFNATDLAPSWGLAKKFAKKNKGRDLSITVRSNIDSKGDNFSFHYGHLFKWRKNIHEILLSIDIKPTPSFRDTCIDRAGLINDLIGMGFQPGMSLPVADDWDGQISDNVVERKVKGGVFQFIATTHPKQT